MHPSRPKYLAIWRIHLPLAGYVSILHRVSGAALVAAIPILLYLLESSLASAERFAELRACLAQPWVKLMLLGLLWAFLHHACAGIRFLLIDIRIGVEAKSAQLGAKLVLAASLALTALIGGLAW